MGHRGFCRSETFVNSEHDAFMRQWRDKCIRDSWIECHFLDYKCKNVLMFSSDQKDEREYTGVVSLASQHIIGFNVHINRLSFFAHSYNWCKAITFPNSCATRKIGLHFTNISSMSSQHLDLKHLYTARKWFSEIWMRYCINIKQER